MIVRFNNKLLGPPLGPAAQPVVVHYHGGHSSPGHDSYPPDGIMPGESRVYAYTNSSTRAATLWYHDHFDPTGTSFEGTGHNVYFGLAGFYILQPAVNPVDPEEDGADRLLPKGLGIFDFPLVIQDRVFDRNNQLVYNPFDFDGVLGNTVLVNGQVQPILRVQPRQYRFRFLNGSNARVYQLSFSQEAFRSVNPEEFIQVGSDGGLLPRAVSRHEFLLAMAERVELVFNFAKFPAGTRLFLTNCLQQTEGRGPDEVTREDCTPLMLFEVDSSGPVSDIPLITDNQVLLPLRGTEDPSAAEAVIEREFRFERSHGGWVINGEFFEKGVVARDGEDKLVTPKLGTVEIWRYVNNSGGWVHPIHAHMEEFKMLDRNERPPERWEKGLKDTFFLDRGDTVRVITRFKGQPGEWVAGGGQESDVGLFVFHCHNLEHEDMHMMANFKVVT